MLRVKTSKAILGLASSLVLFACRREMPATQPPAVPPITDALKTAVVTAGIYNPFIGQPKTYPVQSCYEFQELTTLNGGSGGQMDSVAGVVSDGKNLYICDSARNQVYIHSLSAIASSADLIIGSRTRGFADGPASTAQFNRPTGITVAADGTLFLCDAGNNRIRKISPDRSTVSTVAGNGVAGFHDGVGTLAQFNQPYGIVIDVNNTIYVSDRGNNMIRRITSGNVVTRWCGQPVAGFKDDAGSLAQFNSPYGITIARNGAVYVADFGNNRIRKIVGGVVSTLAGNGSSVPVNGTGTGAAFNTPTGVAADSLGNVYVCEMLAGDVRKITPTGEVSTILGGGADPNHPGSWDSTALLHLPSNLNVDINGTIWETNTRVVRKITFVPATKTVIDGSAGLTTGGGLAIAPDGTLYIMSISGTLSKVNPEQHTLTAIANGFTSLEMTCDAAGNVIAFQGNSIKRVSPAGAISTVIPAGVPFGSPNFDAAGNLWMSSLESGEMLRISATGEVKSFVPQGVGYFRFGITSSAVGWIRDLTPIFPQMTIDRNTGNLYLSYGETMYRYAHDGTPLTLMYGGALGGIFLPPVGSVITKNGVPLHSGDLWVDNGFNSTAIAAGPSGKVYIANRGFDMGFAAGDIHRRYNLFSFDPNTFGLTPLYSRPFIDGDDLAGDAAGPDVDGPTDFTGIGKPIKLVVSPDGKIVFFLSLQTGSQMVSLRKTVAL